jgi:hypothetical protein
MVRFTSRFGAAVVVLVAAAIVAYWTWRSDSDSNPNLTAPETVRAEHGEVRTHFGTANRMQYGASIVGRRISDMGAGTNGGVASPNSGVLNGSSFHANNPR